MIRDAVIHFEYEIQSESQSPLKNQQNAWAHICESLFGKKIEIWSELIAPHYFTQSKVALFKLQFLLTILKFIYTLFFRVLSKARSRHVMKIF